jgi:hypothetical protein
MKMSNKINQSLPYLQAAFSDDRLHPPHHGSGVKIVCNKTFFMFISAFLWIKIKKVRIRIPYDEFRSMFLKE